MQKDLAGTIIVLKLVYEITQLQLCHRYDSMKLYCSLPNNYLVTFHLYIKHKFCIRANVNSCIISTASNVHCSKYSMTLQKPQKLGNVGFAFYYEI